MHREANLTLTLSRSRSSRIIIWTHYPNAIYQVPRSSAFWFWRRRFLKGFYHILVWLSSWSCDQNVLYKFWLTYHKESSHEIWAQFDRWFVRKLCFNILMGFQYERPKLKGQPWPLELIYSHCLILFNISSENNDFGFNSILKTTFQKISHSNALGSIFDLDFK